MQWTFKTSVHMYFCVCTFFLLNRAYREGLGSMIIVELMFGLIKYVMWCAF